MKRTIHFFIKVIMIFSMWTISSNNVSASHIVGGNISYKHMFADVYQIRLTLRRDCFLGDSLAPFDNPAWIWIYNGDDNTLAINVNNNGILKLDFMASDTLNEYIESDCGFEGIQVCVHETIYQGNLRLPSRPGGYTLAYQRCCRNESINNIQIPDHTGGVYWTRVTDEALALKNSSPVFNQWPDVYICANKPLVFDHGATDRDGDSLVYKLCVPSSAGDKLNNRPEERPPFNEIDWASPYDINNLMGGVPLKMDPKTGQFTAMPILMGQYLIGVCVEEYRNGKLIGTVRRDFQYNVRVCSQPPLAQFTTSESNCSGLTVSFFNNSLSAQAFQWDFNFPSTDANFKSSEKDPVFTFPASGIYKVRLRSTRGVDGCFDTLLQTVAVFTNKIEPQFKYLLSGCAQGSDSLTVKLTDLSTFNEPGYVLDKWDWTITQNGTTKFVSGKNPDISIKNSGVVDIKILIHASNGCLVEKTYSLDPTSLIPQSDFTFNVVGCATPGQVSINFNNISAPLNPFAVITNSSWNVNGVNGVGPNPTIIIPQSTGTVKAILSTSFEGNCIVTTEKVFSLQELIPNAGAVLQPIKCPTDDKVELQLTYDNSNDLGLGSTLSWTTSSAGVVNSFSTNTINFVIPKDSLLAYQLVATYANGCKDTVARSLVPGPFAQIVFVNDSLLLCSGQSKTIVTNPNPAWIYTWSPTEGLDLTIPSNPKVSIDKNIKYTVTVSDGLCSVSGEIDVIALSGVNLVIQGNTVTCDGSVNLKVTGGIGQGQYSWSNDPNIINVIATGSDISTNFNGASQTYYVQFVGEVCSSTPAEIGVTNQRPQIDDASPMKICKGDTAKLLTVNIMPTHQNTVSWTPNSHIIKDGDTYTPLIGIGVNEEGTIDLVYNVTNQFGCTFSDTFKLTIVQNPSIDFAFDLKECGSNKFCFDLSGAYQGFLDWNFGDPTTNNDTSLLEEPCYIYGESGTYQVTISNLINVCPFKDLVKTVVVNPTINVDAGINQTLCLGDTLFAKATSNISNTKYIWTDSNGNTVSNLNSFTSVLNQDKQFIVTGTDIYNCFDKDTIFATVFKFDYNINIADSLCLNENSTVNLSITNPNDYTFTWSPAELIVSGANTASPVIKGIAGVDLKLVLKHIASGCEDTRTIKPKVTKPFEFTIHAPNIYCFGQPVDVKLTIDNPEKYNYKWTPAECFVSGTDTQNPVVLIQSNKTIFVLVTEKSSGCKKEGSAVAKVGEGLSVTVDAKPDFSINEGESTILFVRDSMDGYKYIWSTGATSSAISVNPIETSSYEVTVTDKDGCTGSDVVEVEVRNAKCDESDIFIPNAFSPNRDGVNDSLYVRSNFIEELELVVFNRWGQEVFKSLDQKIGWDGTFKNEELAPDAFAYYMKVKCINGEVYAKKGNISLIR
jgi:gliding motility-associated-like protein